MAAMPDRDVYNVIRGKVELPVMPMVATKIVEECENPDVTAADLGRIIADDIALTGRLLNLANSAAYRRRMPVETVEAAVVRVGIVVWARSASMVNVPVPRIVASKNAVTTAVVAPVGSVLRAPSATSMESAKGMVQSI